MRGNRKGQNLDNYHEWGSRTHTNGKSTKNHVGQQVGQLPNRPRSRETKRRILNFKGENPKVYGQVPSEANTAPKAEKREFHKNGAIKTHDIHTIQRRIARRTQWCAVWVFLTVFGIFGDFLYFLWCGVSGGVRGETHLQNTKTENAQSTEHARTNPSYQSIELIELYPMACCARLYVLCVKSCTVECVVGRGVVMVVRVW